MLFSSVIFLCLFLPVVLALYYCPFFLGRGYKNFILFSISILFYAWGEPFYVFLLLASIIFNWIIGLAAKGRFAGLAVGIGVAVNIAVLMAFKYLDFLLYNIGLITNSEIRLTGLPLPIGISFYTFQAISYIVDVKRGKAKARVNPMEIGLYISLFPQLIAGPIVRYETIAEEIKGRAETIADFYAGMQRLIIGLSKKVILANSMGFLADSIFDTPGMAQSSMATAWIAALAYTFQIFFDFSGYSDMAIGLGRIFGFHFLENFNFPYVAKSVSEFWRRWHISLSTWFRDYVYFPMGGSRVTSKFRLLFNLFVVWSLTGIWHGANWTFLLWGIFYFILIALEKTTGFNKRFGWFGHVYTMSAVIAGWVLFRSPTAAVAVQHLKTMLGIGVDAVYDEITIWWLEEYWLVFLVAAFFSVQHCRIGSLWSRLPAFIARPVVFVVLMVLLAVNICMLVKSTHNPFIYFNF